MTTPDSSDLPVSPSSEDEPVLETSRPGTGTSAIQGPQPSTEQEPAGQAKIDFADDQYATRAPSVATPHDPYATTEGPTEPDGAPPPAYPKAAPAGVRVGGYEILSELGRGGMGVVYKALHVALKRLVALKMVLGHGGADSLARFRGEAEAVARLQHPNIVQIYEVGELNGQPFFSLEFVEGGSLDKQLAGTPLPPAEAAQLVQTLAGAMHAAHKRGIIHRDLKPANILLQSADLRLQNEDLQPPDASPKSKILNLKSAILKITDFGLAKQLDEEGGRTQSGAIMGTPSYMAPEQAQGNTAMIGPVSDVYALGAILYEMLTGRPPFRGTTVWETLDQVRTQDPVSPSRLQPKMPGDLETICLTCLRKEPGKRYASAAALADDLRRFQAGEPILARRVGLWERGLKYARRKPWVVGAWMSGMAAALFLVAGGAYYIYRQYLDLEAELVRNNALEDIQVRATARVSTAEDALKKRDWLNVVAGANETLALIGDEPGLGGLVARAGLLRAAAQNVLRFTDQRDQAMFHAVFALEEGADQRDHEQAAQAAAGKALALFGLGGVGPAALPRFGDAPLTPDTKRWLTESCYELYLTWSEVLSRTSTRKPVEQRGRAEEALRMLDRAARLGLTTRSYHQRRADLLRTLGDAAGAKEEQERAAAQTPFHAVDHFLLGMELMRAGEMERATANFKKVLELQPEHFWASYCLANCYLRMQPPRLARSLGPLTVCIQMKPKIVWSYLLRGVANGELNDFEAAFADFDAAEKLAGEEVAWYSLRVNRAFVRLRQGMNHENHARALGERGLTAEAKREDQLARSFFDKAVPDLEQAVKLRPQKPQAYTTLAEVHRLSGRLKEALTQLDQAIALAPSARLYRTRATLHEKREAYEAALADLEKAIQRAQATREVAGDQLQRGRILLELGKYPAALEAFDKTLAAAPDLVAAHQLRGRTLLELAAAHQLRGETRLELDRIAEAVAALDRYLAKGPPSALASRTRGHGRTKLKDYAGAIEDYSRALEIDLVEGKATDPSTLVLRGRAYLIMDAPKLALRDFDTALQIQGDNRLQGDNQGDCLAGRGYARVLLGQWEPAVTDAEAAIKEGSPPARTLYNTARIYAQAIAKSQKDPKQQDRSGRDLRKQYMWKAVELLRSACEKKPAAEQAVFWKDYVEVDPALLPISSTPDFARLRAAFAEPTKSREH